MEENSSTRLLVMGVQLHPVRMSQALDRIRSYTQAGGFHLVVTLGTEMVMRAQHEPQFRELVNQASLVVPDGVGLVWAARFCGYPAPEKVAGVELVQALPVALPGSRWFLLGGEPGVAEAAAEGLRKLSPDIQIVGCQHGFFKDDEAVVSAIAASGAQIVLAGLGSPRQEQWLTRHGPRLGAAVGIGVGGSFDVLAGRLKRAPSWMVRLGLEWLYRLLLQPSRWMRMLALPRFALRVLLSGRRAVIRGR